MLEHGVDYLKGACERCIVGLPDANLEEGRHLLDGTGALCLAGGQSKQETVALLLAHCDADTVVVHDVSQFQPPPDLLHRVIAALAESGSDAVAPVLPMAVRGALATRGDDMRMTGVIDREHAVMSHTPQAYRRESLTAALARAQEHGWKESGIYALVHRNGGDVRLIDGDPNQLKLTYPQDLDVLEEA